MVLIGLLLIALVCLALGLVLASAGWLIGSLAASAAAAWVLWRGRDRVVTAADQPTENATGAAETAEHTDGEDVPVTANSVPEAASEGSAAAEAPAESDYARRRVDELGSLAQPVRGASSVAVAVQTAPPADPDVWVIDGRPNYHTPHCGVLLGADAEMIPRSQAVEDGFTPCTLCDPDAHFEPPAPASPDAASDGGDGSETASAARTVWVVDGWPHYHDGGCPRLADERGEAVPYEQAVDDGFTPCPTCRPAGDEAAYPDVVEYAEVAAYTEQTVEQTFESDSQSEPATAAAVPDVEEAPEADPEATELDGIGAADVVESEPAAAEPAAAEVEAISVEAEVVEPEAEVAEAEVAEPEPEAVPAEPEAETVEPDSADDSGRPDQPEYEAAAADDVWVVAGRPRFHREDCMIIEEQGAVRLSYGQALEDGFRPCSLCEPIPA